MGSCWYLVWLSRMSSPAPGTQQKEENRKQTFSLDPKDQTKLKQLCAALVTTYKEEGKKRVFQCKKCGKEFADEWCAYRHVDDHHLPHVQHKCNKCPKVFSNNASLELHVQRKHDVTAHEKEGNGIVQEEQDVQKARITRKEKEPLPVEENQDRASYVNKQWRIVGLVSDKGKPLNGQTGTVVDYDTGTEEARLHWRLEAGGKIVKVNPRNLQALEEVFDRKEMSVKEIAAEMVARERASFVDKPWRIINLTSYRGRQLNNRECWVRDFDTDCQARLHWHRKKYFNSGSTRAAA